MPSGHKKTHEEFVAEMLVVNPSVLVTSAYTGRDNKVDCTCRLCGHEWAATPHNLLLRSRPRRCPRCRPNSRAEERTAGILKSHGVGFSTRVQRIIPARPQLHADILIPAERFVIELSGRHHWQPVEAWGGEKALAQVQNNDRQKEQGLADQRVNLLVIPYTVPNTLYENLIWFRHCGGEPWASHENAIKVQPTTLEFSASWLAALRKVTT